jgi:serine/threonine-protein kinase HipA
MKAKQKKIFIYADFEDQSNKQIGTLYATLSRGKEIFSFEYSVDWLSCKSKPILDPDLQFFSGKQYLNDDKYNY